MQSHQNKFHVEALRKLTGKFASMREGDTVSATDKELWDYFSALYKNSNKGIKGRGKDRRISMTVGTLATAMYEGGPSSRSPPLSGHERAMSVDHAWNESSGPCSIGGEKESHG
ncbi:hypothetical protein MMC34_005424 [Xylographa carneopallida]|nr:hypothetical protein [Xylographa carneopallida]